MKDSNKQDKQKPESRCKREVVRGYILKRKRLSEKKDLLAEKIGVSRMTLWLYLREMVNEGLIEMVPVEGWGFGHGTGKRIVVRGGAQ